MHSIHILPVYRFILRPSEVTLTLGLDFSLPCLDGPIKLGKRQFFTTLLTFEIAMVSTVTVLFLLEMFFINVYSALGLKKANKIKMKKLN